jgi:hypothetical protein
MTVSTEATRHRHLSALCLLGLALLFVTNPLTKVLTPDENSSIVAVIGFVAVADMVLMVGALAGIVRLLSGKADRTALAGAAMTIIGWTASARIMAVFQMKLALAKGANAAVAQEAFGAAIGSDSLVFASFFVVGLLLPIGLITLGSALAITAPVSRWYGVLLTAGGVLFPIGRAVGNDVASTAADIVLATAFTAIAWVLLRTPALWTGTVSMPVLEPAK